MRWTRCALVLALMLGVGRPAEAVFEQDLPPGTGGWWDGIFWTQNPAPFPTEAGGYREERNAQGQLVLVIKTRPRSGPNEPVARSPHQFVNAQPTPFGMGSYYRATIYGQPQTQYTVCTYYFLNNGWHEQFHLRYPKTTL